MLTVKDIFAIICFIIVMLCEIMWSGVTAPFQTAEMPLVVSTGYDVTPFTVPFKPLWWGNGHYTQTLLHTTLGFSTKKEFRRDYCILSDNTKIALDIIETKSMTIDTPIVFVCHGLYGCSDNGVVHALGHALPDYRIIVYNRRGHAGTNINGKFPKHVDIGDMTEVLSYVKTLYPTADMTGFGFSAGANLIVQYIGTVPDNPFKKVISIANGHHLYELTDNVNWIINQLVVYMMRNFAVDHIPERRNLLRKCQTVREIEFETAAKLNGYQTLKEYYDECSSCNWLEQVNIPLLSISAEDDPLIKAPINYYAVKAAAKNKHIIAIVTKKGGHVAWIDRFGHSWAIDRMVDFIRMQLD